MWHETNDDKKREPSKGIRVFLLSEYDLIMSGPHFYVGSPYYKTPRAVCAERSHYDSFDLSICPTTICPEPITFRLLSSGIPQANAPDAMGREKPVTEYYR